VWNKNGRIRQRVHLVVNVFCVKFYEEEEPGRTDEKYP